MVAAIGARGSCSSKVATFAPGWGSVQSRIDRDTYHPRQDSPGVASVYLRVLFVQEAWVRAGQAEDLGRPRAQALDRGGQEAACITTCWLTTCQQLAASPGASWTRGPGLEAAE